MRSSAILTRIQSKEDAMFEPDRMGEVIDGHTLRFVRVVKHTPERVWRAITDEKELSEWMRYPVKFDARVGGHAYFFDSREAIERDHDSPGVAGKIFIFDPPRTLAYSFSDPKRPDEWAVAEREWMVRWDLEPVSGGCRITFIHRGLGGALLWGLGEGWHGFIEQLQAHLDGTLHELVARFARNALERDDAGLRLYRQHVTAQLASFAAEAAADARRCASAQQGDVVLAVDRLALAARQLGRIAVQEGARPDYTLPDAGPLEP
jgi:uncharacterized protein YndB with AHSA1/START domain